VRVIKLEYERGRVTIVAGGIGDIIYVGSHSCWKCPSLRLQRQTGLVAKVLFKWDIYLI